MIPRGMRATQIAFPARRLTRATWVPRIGQHRRMTAPIPPTFRTLRVEFHGSLGRITLDQPERLNPLGAVTLRELAAAAAWFDQTEASIVVVAGAGRAFCAGFDLRELTAPAHDSGSPDGHGGAATPTLGAAMADAISSMQALTVAAVQGPCVGGGFVLALCCDLRIASDDAWFSLPEAELGIPLAWSGVPRLVRELGPARANELILTCRRVGAAEALAIGLVNEVVAAPGLEDVVATRVSVLLERRADVILTTKRQVREAAESLVPTTGAWAGTEELLTAVRRLAETEE